MRKKSYDPRSQDLTDVDGRLAIPGHTDAETEGYRREWVPQDDWKVGGDGRRCRRPNCPNFAVAAMRRSDRHCLRGWNWWYYCEEHLYGGEIRDGVVKCERVISASHGRGERARMKKSVRNNRRWEVDTIFTESFLWSILGATNIFHASEYGLKLKKLCYEGQDVRLSITPIKSGLRQARTGKRR